MGTGNRRSFVAGVASAVPVCCLGWLYFNASFQGGHIEDSPSGKYTLAIFGPMNERNGGTYRIIIRDTTTGVTLRTYSITLSFEEMTKSLRGAPVRMDWDMSEEYADIVIDGEFLIRVSVP
ncbi:MAG: hypothetical protein ABI557_06260 [Aureliella sp.]